jgi:hypothetical protein
MGSKQQRPQPERRNAAGRGAAPRSNAARLAASRRKRQLVAVGSIVGSLVLALAIVLLSQQPPAATGAPDRHSIGKPDAPVTITEWSDFQ